MLCFGHCRTSMVERVGSCLAVLVPQIVGHGTLGWPGVHMVLPPGLGRCLHGPCQFLDMYLLESLKLTKLLVWRQLRLYLALKGLGDTGCEELEGNTQQATSNTEHATCNNQQATRNTPQSTTNTPQLTKNQEQRSENKYQGTENKHQIIENK